jgi:mRNA interferase RelE/StbE
MQLLFTRVALRALLKMDSPLRRDIWSKLRFYVSQKDPLRFAERLKKPAVGSWRFRIGDYRVIFDIIKDKIVILKIGHRRDIYS